MRKNRTKRRRTRSQRGGFLNQIKSFFGFGDKKETPVAGQPVHPATSTEPVTSELPPSTTPPSHASVEPLTSSSQQVVADANTKEKVKNIKEKQEEPVKREDLAGEDKCVFLVHNFK